MTTPYKVGQKVELVILRETDLGFVARINGKDEGLLYHSEIFEELEPGQELPGFIKKLRDDGEIDLILHTLGTKGAGEDGEIILDKLIAKGGFMAINDKTSPETIYNLFGISKKKYKIALGGLYKRRVITVDDDGIRLVKKSKS